MLLCKENVPRKDLVFKQIIFLTTRMHSVAVHEKSYISIQLFQPYEFFIDFFSEWRRQCRFTFKPRRLNNFSAKTSIQNNECVDIKNRGGPSPQNNVKINGHDRFNYYASFRIKQKLRFVINAGTEIKIALI